MATKKAAAKDPAVAANDAATLSYLTDVLEILKLPATVDIDLPPENLTGWKPPTKAAVAVGVEDAPRETILPKEEKLTKPPANAKETLKMDEKPPVKQVQTVPTITKEVAPQSSPSEKTKKSEGEAIATPIKPAKVETKASAEVTPKTLKRRSESPERDTPKAKIAKIAHLTETQPKTAALTPVSTPQVVSRVAIPVAPVSSPQSLDMIFSDDPAPSAELPEFFTKEQLKTFSARGKELGRKLKHAGDALHRAEGASKDAGLLEQADAILVYCYTFWCDDLLAGRTDEHGRLTKPACLTNNWHTINGLLDWVRKRALDNNWALLVSLTHLINAIILQHQLFQDRRYLHNYIERNLPSTRNLNAQSNNEQSNQTTTPQSTGAASTPPVNGQPTEAVPAAVVAKIQDQFLAYSNSREKVTTALNLSRNLVDLSYLRSHARGTAQICLTTNARPIHVIECKRPWKFTFVIETHHSFSAMSHLVAFGKSILEDIAKEKSIDFRATDI